MKSKIKDKTGSVFGRLTITSFAYRKGRQNYWNCTCICGNVKVVGISNLRSKNVSSCGCLYKDSGDKKATHRDCLSREYSTWSHMKRRCINTDHKNYKHYGGRGIKVCDRWLDSYDNFLIDMGRAPTIKHTIDRIDNNGNYEPSNCIWVTMIEQANNRRSNVKITYGDKTLTIAQWSRELKFNYKRLWSRLDRGWSLGCIMSEIGYTDKINSHKTE